VRNTYKVLVGKSEGKYILGLIGNDDINMDLKEFGYEGVDLINLTQDSVKWQAFANTVMDFWVL
jgi:hypothetical protein